MSAGRDKPVGLVDQLILAGLGVPSGLAAFLGGFAVMASIADGAGARAVVASAAVLLGGLAGIWGAHNLRFSGARRSRLAMLGAGAGVCGFIAVVGTFVTSQLRERAVREMMLSHVPRLIAFAEAESLYYAGRGTYTADKQSLASPWSWRGDPPIVVVSATTDRLEAGMDGSPCRVVRGAGGAPALDAAEDLTGTRRASISCREPGTPPR